MRTCLLRDVCFVAGELTYFVDPDLERTTPEVFRLQSMLNRQPEGQFGRGTGFAYPGYLAGNRREARFLPRPVLGPRPASLPFHDDDRVYIMGELSNAQNYGHLLIDTILPTLSVAEAYGLPPRDTQYVGFVNCATMVMGADSTPLGSNADQCLRHVDRWMRPILERPPLFPPHADGCFRRAIYGHEPQLSLAGLYLHRGSAMRTARQRLYKSLGIASRADFADMPHRIVVLLKVVLVVGVELENLCTDVRKWASELVPEPKVDCIKPGDFSVKEQLEIVGNATLVVAEHGSTTYMSMFQPPGTSMLVIVPYATIPAKEVQVLLFNIDVQTFYAVYGPLVEEGKGPGTLLMALERADRRLNVGGLNATRIRLRDRPVNATGLAAANETVAAEANTTVA